MDLAAVEVREEVLGVLRAVAGRLSEGCARVDVEEGLSIDEGEWRCTLRPAKGGEGCSEVVVEVPGSEAIWIGVAAESYVEVAARGPGWRDPRFGSHVEELEAIADAVVSGRLTETIWSRGESVKKTRAVLDLADGPFESIGYYTLLPRWGCARTTTHFRAYCVKR